jgi:hypothetical protein
MGPGKAELFKKKKKQARAHCEKIFLKQAINRLMDTLHRGNIHLLQYALNRLESQRRRA